MLDKFQNKFSETCVEGGTEFSFEIKGLVHEEQTEFQHIAIYESTQFGYVMAIDGFNMLTSRDNFLYHEMMTHPALFMHQNPQQVAIIGGGDCGSLREVLKHPGVEKAWQIDIDKRVTDLSEIYFPELCVSNDDKRANLQFGDGIQWVKESQPESLDIIIVDSTDPIGPAEGLFSRPFYEDCFRALKAGGIIIQQSESPLYHREKIILPMHKAMREAGFGVTQTLYFPQPCYPSGWWSGTLACKAEHFPQFRREDCDNRTFKTVYYNGAIHEAALAPPQFMKEALEASHYL